MSLIVCPDLSLCTFKEKLEHLQNELSSAEKIGRDLILTEAINDRLHEALLTYHKEIDRSSRYLLSVASAKVLKEITRINRQEDRAVIEQYMIDD